MNPTPIPTAEELDQLRLKIASATITVLSLYDTYREKAALHYADHNAKHQAHLASEARDAAAEVTA